MSGNCQAVFEMAWEFEDIINAEKTYCEYEKVRKELNQLLGADQGYVNYVVRSPFYLPGHHRINPNASKKLINITNDALWHHSVWYQPHRYTLTELKGIIEYLKKLHDGHGKIPSEFLEGGAAAPNVKRLVETQKKSKKPIETKPARRFPISKQREHAAIPAAYIHEHGRDGNSGRNCWLFAGTAVACRRADIAAKYRGSKDREGFLAYARTIAFELNGQLHEPMDRNEVEGIVTSVVGYCLGPRFKAIGWTSKEARYLADHRWKGHVSVATKAARLEISKATYYRHRSFYEKLFQI